MNSLTATDITKSKKQSKSYEPGYKNDFIRKSYDRLTLCYPKDTLVPRLKARAADTGESLTKLIGRMLETQLAVEEQRKKEAE